MGIHKQIAGSDANAHPSSTRRPLPVKGRGLRISRLAATLERSAFTQHAHAHNDVPDEDEQGRDTHNNDEADT